MGIGIDLVKISRIKDLMKDENAVKKIFMDEEMSDNIEVLAGIFAAKEAYFKAIGEKKDWHSVIVKKEVSGKPYLITSEEEVFDVSITHEEEYAAAVVMKR